MLYLYCLLELHVNSVTQFDAYPMPRIDEMLHQIGQPKFITTLDLTKGYWHALVGPADKKNSILEPHGLVSVQGNTLWTKWGSCNIPTNYRSSTPWD